MIYYAEIQTALNFIEKNLDKPLTVDNIAAVAGFSKYHFHRIFRNETGWSGLWMRIDDAFSRTLVLDNNRMEPLRLCSGCSERRRSYQHRHPLKRAGQDLV